MQRIRLIGPLLLDGWLPGTIELYRVYLIFGSEFDGRLLHPRSILRSHAGGLESRAFVIIRVAIQSSTPELTFTTRRSSVVIFSVVSVSVSVCPVRAPTFGCLDLQTLYLLRRYIFLIFGSRLSIEVKVIRGTVIPPKLQRYSIMGVDENFNWRTEEAALWLTIGKVRIRDN